MKFTYKKDKIKTNEFTKYLADGTIDKMFWLNVWRGQRNGTLTKKVIIGTPVKHPKPVPVFNPKPILELQEQRKRIDWLPVTAEKIVKSGDYKGNEKLIRKFINEFFILYEHKWGRHKKISEEGRGRLKTQYRVDFQKIAILKELLTEEDNRIQLKKLLPHWSSIDVDRYLKTLSADIDDYIKTLHGKKGYFDSKAEVEEWLSTSNLTIKEAERILQFYESLVSEIYTRDNKWNDEGLYKIIRPKRKIVHNDCPFA